MRYFILLGVVVAAALGYAAYWVYLAGLVPDRFNAWADQQRARGWTVSYDEVRVSGFPFRLEASVLAPRLAQPGSAAAPAWEGERIDAVAHPWNLTHILFHFEGRQRIAFVERRRSRIVDVTMAENVGSYRTTTGGKPLRLSFEADGLELRSVDLPGPATVRRAVLHMRRAEATNRLGDAALKVEGLRLPAGVEAPLGRDIDLLDVILGLTGALPNGLPPSDAVIAWRDAGGTVEVQKFDVTWGAVKAAASGTLQLDETTRPAGEMTAKIRGHEALLDAAAATGRIRARDLDLAKSALGLLAAAGGGVLSVPVRLQNGSAYLGPVLVGRLRPLISDDGRSRAPRSPARRQ